MAKDKCGTCAYWVRNGVGIPVLGAPQDGTCRFLPPALVYFMTAPPNAQGHAPVSVMGHQAPVNSEAWCGQHKEGRGDGALAS